ncbi:SRPBCC domain-containing protein [Kitasatospora sp. NPDC057223]|uniref:SRPBCC domain-containing protein n=1 Tax=Kitasatospora sp. NPDC057223 TaxID=3346055 RepID=UPI003631DE7E
MAREFEVRREVVLPAAPQEVFAAVTGAVSAWMFPAPEGSAEAGATVWEPPGRYAVRVEDEDGRPGSLEYDIRPREAAGSVLRYAHTGAFPDDDWDVRYDSCSRHTDFYLHTLGQYLRYFDGRPAVFVGVEAPAASAAADAFDVLLDELHLDKEVRVGDRLSVELDEVGVLEAEVDYRSPQFLGLRTHQGLIRFFGRNAFGGRVGVTLHLFADEVDRAGTERAWQRLLDGLYGG